MNKILLPLIAFPAIALVGCNPSGDGRGTVDMAFDASQNTTSRAVTRAAGSFASIPVTAADGSTEGHISLTDAWIVAKEIELEHENDDDNAPDEELEIEFVGPFAVNLLTGETYPPMPRVTVDTGLYNDIEIDIEKLQPGDLVGMPNLPQYIESKLLNYSLYLEGTYSSAAGGLYSNIPFSMSYDATDEFEFTAPEAFSNGFIVSDSGITDILVAFRTDEWFRFDNTETNPDTTAFLGLEEVVVDNGSGDEIVLDTNTNNDYMDIIEDNIEDSAEYGEDDNNDGILGEDEDDD